MAMKSTQIIRRIDDLGRVVIPKEIRKQFAIKVGEPLEIYTDPTEKIIGFKKYERADPIFALNEMREEIACYGEYTYEDIDEMVGLLNEVEKILKKY